MHSLVFNSIPHVSTMQIDAATGLHNAYLSKKATLPPGSRSNQVLIGGFLFLLVDSSSLW
jgi:hypothetical protein